MKITCKCGNRIAVSETTTRSRVRCPRCGKETSLGGPPAKKRKRKQHAAPDDDWDEFGDGDVDVQPKRRRPQRTKSREKRKAKRLRSMPRDIEKLHQTFRVFCLFLGLFNVVLLLGSVAILLSSPEPEADPETVPKWIAALCVPVGLLGAITSEATRNRKRWALDLIWIFAAIWLLAFPIGTVLGGYILYHFRTLRPYYG